MTGLSLVAGHVAHGEVVSIQNGKGHGFLFHYAQQCLMVLPQHVHGRRPSLTFSGRSVQFSGQASVLYQHIDELDLSLAQVTQIGGDNCGPAWFDLVATRGQTLPDQVTLRRVEGQGVSTRTPMHVNEQGPTRFRAKVFSAFSANGIYQGTSGATAFAGTVPIGMAIEAPRADTADFLRYDRIVEGIARVAGLPMEKPSGSTVYSEFEPSAGMVRHADEGPAAVYTPDQPTFAPVLQLRKGPTE
ncbi:hypothetical protein [Shimia sp. SDUM112013]|uniref:hypothetical protein n=1 Tax=Shimia sp. SDUM112013 TaxID=3136160 RepID=UPI0032EC81D6